MYDNLPEMLRGIMDRGCRHLEASVRGSCIKDTPARMQSGNRGLGAASRHLFCAIVLSEPDTAPQNSQCDQCSLSSCWEELHGGEASAELGFHHVEEVPNVPCSALPFATLWHPPAYVLSPMNS